MNGPPDGRTDCLAGRGRGKIYLKKRKKGSKKDKKKRLLKRKRKKEEKDEGKKWEKS